MTQHTVALDLLAIPQPGTTTPELVNPPALDYVALAPLLIIFGGACIAILLEGILRNRKARVYLQVTLVSSILVAAFAMLVANWVNGRFGMIAYGMLANDKASYLLQGTLMFFTALSLCLLSTRHAHAMRGAPEEERYDNSEVYVLALFSLFGMMLFVSSSNLIMLFVALEVMSLPLYVLTAMARYKRKISQEAALKYFMLGVLAAAIMLYGIAMLYGSTGSLTLSALSAQSAAPAKPALLIVGLVFVVIGLLFKVGAVPFHSWVPDVYQGAPTPVTAFMAIGVKLAAVAALARVLAAGIPLDGQQWEIVILVLAVLSMVFGAILTMIQKDVKRLIAYSSITHAGFILTALVGANHGIMEMAGLKFTVLSSVLVYLIAYGLATLGAFAIVTLVRRTTGEEVTDIAAWEGFGREHPILGAAFALYFLSFAGFPITAGFIGKFTVFSVPWLAGHGWVVVVALLVSGLAAYAYVRMIIQIFFKKPSNAVVVSKPTVGVGIVVLLTAVLTVLMGVVPGPLLELVNQAGTFLM